MQAPLIPLQKLPARFLDNAVNIPLAKILKPIKNSSMVQILFPVTARSYTGLSGRANTDTNGLVSRKDAATVTTEIAAITFRLTATIFSAFPDSSPHNNNWASEPRHKNTLYKGSLQTSVHTW